MDALTFRTALRELGMSQATFANKAGAAPITVNRWATGKASVPGWVSWVIELLRERREIVDKLAR